MRMCRGRPEPLLHPVDSSRHVENPNAAGVLFVGLGCEINDIESFKPALGDFDPKRIKFIIYQDVEDEFEESTEALA